MRRAINSRAMKDGEDTNHSATPIYHHQVKQMIRAYAKAGIRDAMARMFCLLGLWVSGGRSGEPKFTAIEACLWCFTFTALFCRVPQSKVSKMKLVAWVAGADPDLCIFAAFGANLALNPRSVDDDGTSWLYEALQVSNPKPCKKTRGLRQGPRTG